MIVLMHSEMGFLQNTPKVKTVMGIGQSDSISNHIGSQVLNLSAFINIIGLCKINPFQPNPKTEQVSKRNK